MKWIELTDAVDGTNILLNTNSIVVVEDWGDGKAAIRTRTSSRMFFPAVESYDMVKEKLIRMVIFTPDEMRKLGTRTRQIINRGESYEIDGNR